MKAMKGETMIEMKDDAIVFAFPEVHDDARCTVAFQRTLRLPGDGRDQPLPPGLGRYRLLRAGSYGERLPRNCRPDSLLFPMYQSEALLIVFIGWYPCAIKVTSNGKNALTGRKSFDDRLWRPMDYVTFPQHPWMEWFSLGPREARQFVADPITADEKAEKLSDITVTIYPMIKDDFEAYREQRALVRNGGCSLREGGNLDNASWEITSRACCTVHPVNTGVFRTLTGRTPESPPPGRNDYRNAGIPWNESYGMDDMLVPVAGTATAC